MKSLKRQQSLFDTPGLKKQPRVVAAEHESGNDQESESPSAASTSKPYVATAIAYIIL